MLIKTEMDIHMIYNELTDAERKEIEELGQIKRWKQEQRKAKLKNDYDSRFRQTNRDMTKSSCDDKKAPQWSVVLGVPYPCTLQEAKQAFHELIKKHHPDLGGASDSFRRVKEAWDQAIIEFRYHP